jgi:hypothetical protein
VARDMVHLHLSGMAAGLHRVRSHVAWAPVPFSSIRLIEGDVAAVSA